MQNMQILRSPGNTIIRVNDSENAQKLSKSHLQFDTVLDSDNFCNCVDISKLSKEHDYAKARPAISAYTGTDYLSALYRKGNLRPLLLMKKKNSHLGMHLQLWTISIYQKLSSLILWNLSVICMTAQKTNALMMSKFR